jgi:Concanavalin A-like lectin/glucanases superfamily
VAFGHPAFLTGIGAALTLECIVKIMTPPEADGLYYFISLGDEGSGFQGFYLRYFNNGGTLYLEAGDYGGETRGASHAYMLPPTAVHIVATFDSADWRLYINGQLVATNNEENDEPFESADALFVGGLDSLIGRCT